jgi:hypothetical protein
MIESTAQEAVSRKGSIPELIVVFGLTVGVPVVMTVATGRFANFDFGQRRLLTSLAIEGATVAVLWPWLASRGWSFPKIAGAPVPGADQHPSTWSDIHRLLYAHEATVAGNRRARADRRHRARARNPSVGTRDATAI